MTRVRRQQVLEALVNLKRNNKYYENIEIDSEALEALPEDGELEDLHVIRKGNDDASFEDISPVGAIADEAKEQKETNEVHFSHSVVLSAALNLTERQKLDKFIDSLGNKSADKQAEEKGDSCKENCDQQDHMSWPTYGSNPISEFTTEGYFTQAFPALFPMGAGDFRSPRLRSVTLGEYLKHIMRYIDGRFARHPRFRYFALNTMMRWRALETAQGFVKQNPSDAAITVEELREMTKTSKIPHFPKKLSTLAKVCTVQNSTGTCRRKIFLQ